MNLLYRTIGTFAVLLAGIAVVAAIRSALATYQAERKWARSLNRVQGAHQKLVELNRKHQQMLDGEIPVTTAEIDIGLVTLVRTLEERQDITRRERRHLEAALHQPSNQGRRNYREKLLEEGLAGRVMIA